MLDSQKSRIDGGLIQSVQTAKTREDLLEKKDTDSLTRLKKY